MNTANGKESYLSIPDVFINWPNHSGNEYMDKPESTKKNLNHAFLYLTSNLFLLRKKKNSKGAIK